MPQRPTLHVQQKPLIAMQKTLNNQPKKQPTQLTNQQEKIQNLSRETKPEETTSKCRKCGGQWPHTDGPCPGKGSVATVDMTGLILKQNHARQKARNVNLVESSITSANAAGSPKPDHLQSKSTQDKSMTKRAQVTSQHGQSVQQDRMTGHSPTLYYVVGKER